MASLARGGLAEGSESEYLRDRSLGCSRRFAPYATVTLLSRFVREFGHDDCYLRPTW
jgi:hypothetical protein